VIDRIQQRQLAAQGRPSDVDVAWLRGPDSADAANNDDEGERCGADRRQP